ncbi:MAG: sigma-70 family RNA polymerase sigma factor [Vicinamibacterales bacterium]
MPGAQDELSDEALLGLAAGGDADAFDVFLLRHSASVFRLARALLRQPDEAEDVLQQTFLSAWRHAAQFRGEASARTWLFAIARHAAVRHRRTRAREPVDDAPIDDLGLEAGWGGPDPEAMAVAAEDRERLSRALAALTDEQREILTLRELEGLSGEETARVLGLGLAAMKSRLHRARLALAGRLRNEVSRATGRA